MFQQPTPQIVAQWQAWLTQAQTAYHALMLGQSAVEVAVDGNTYVTRFARADADRLQAYIADLESKIDAATFVGHPRGGAIGILF